MKEEHSGTLYCANCDFGVQLSADNVPDCWYEETGKPPVPAEHATLPFCVSCNRKMKVVATCTNFKWEARSLAFHCLDSKRIVHSMEGYFSPLPAEEIASKKRALAETYAYFMLKEAIAHGIPLERIISGPEYVTMNLSRLSEVERNERIERYWGFQFVGLVTDLEVNEEEMVIRFNRGLVTAKVRELTATLHQTLSV